MSGREASSTPAPRDRWIPWAFVGFFLVVLAANATMIAIGVATWPGLDTRDAYQRGLAYNRTLDAAAAQAALGWRVAAGFTRTGPRRGVVEVTLADRFGDLVEDAAISAAFLRPASAGHDLLVGLEHVYGGRYRAEVELPLAGQWDLQIEIAARGEHYRLRERTFVRP